MKRKNVIALIVAAVLVVSGAALAAVGLELGGGRVELFSPAAGQSGAQGNFGSWQGGSGNGEGTGSGGAGGGNAAASGNGGQSDDDSMGSWPRSEELSVLAEKLVVNWTGGSVVIRGADVDEISFYESAGEGLCSENGLVYRLEDDTLYIDYMQDRLQLNFFGGSGFFEKQLTVTVPAYMEKILVETSSASVELSDVETEQLELDSTSGAITVKGCHVADGELESTSGKISFEGSASELDLYSVSGEIEFYGDCGDFSAHSTSGKISFEGSAKDFEADSTSGDVKGIFTRLPEEIEVETTSGDVELGLPQDSGFELEFDSSSGKLDLGFEAMIYDGEYVAGSGEAGISIETTSGDCRIIKN